MQESFDQLLAKKKELERKWRDLHKQRLLKQKEFPFRTQMKSSPEYLEEMKLRDEINHVKAQLHAYGHKIGNDIITANEKKQAQIRDAKRNNPQNQAKREKRKASRHEGWNEFKEGIKDQYSSAVRTAVNAGKSIAKSLPLGDSKEAIIEGIKGGKVFEEMGKQVKGVHKTIKGAAKLIFNDLKWYQNYPEASTEMIGPNFNRRIGISEPLLDLNSSGSMKPSITTSVRFEIALTHGDNNNGAVDAALSKLYTAIRQANSGSVNWDTKDLDGYIYNWRVLISVYNTGCRALRELNKFSIVNKAVPYANFGAMGLDYDTFSANAANLRNLLINLRTRMKCLAIPNLDVIKRTDWLFKSSYWDSDDSKHSTYYITLQNTLVFWDPVNKVSSGIAILGNPANGITGITYQGFEGALRTVAKALLDFDQYGIISGDIVRAYGVDNLFNMDDVPSINDMPLEGYSEEVLTQIQNAYNPASISTRTGDLQVSITAGSTTDVANNEVVRAVTATLPNANLLSGTYVNMYKNNISNADVLGATRFQCLGDSTTSGQITCIAYGTEVFSKASLVRYDYGTVYSSNGHLVAVTNLESISFLDVTSQATCESTGIRLSGWSQVDWFPRITIQFVYYQLNSSNYSSDYGPVLWDFNNFAYITSPSQMRDIHDVATQSLYYTPLFMRKSNTVAY